MNHESHERECGVGRGDFFTTEDTEDTEVITCVARAFLTRGTKVEWECETDFLWRKNAVFLGWWGA